MKNGLMILAVLILSQFAFAIPASRLNTDFEGTILPFIRKSVSSHLFYGVDQKKIHYIHFKTSKPKGAVIVLPGRGETAYKYSEFIYDLKGQGYDIFVLDHRGQGLSDRFLDDKVKSHVDSFDNYVTDLETFMSGAIRSMGYKKTYLVAHSLGGAIAAGYLVKNPRGVTGAFLSAPMFDINTGKFGPSAEFLANALAALGYGANYAPGQKPYNPAEKYEDNVTTTSVERYKMNKRLLELRPDLQMGGSTVQWVKESLAFTRNLRSKNDVFQVPTIVLQAENDQYVNPKGQKEICTVHSPKYCKMFYVPGAKHELFMEKDTLRDRVMALLVQFINHY